MSSKLVTIPVTENALEAAREMRKKGVSSVLVIKKGKEKNPIGIVTERDLINRVCAEGLRGSDVTVREIMSSPIAMVERGATVETAADLMLHNNVRHLLVIDDRTSKPVGILAPRDLNRYLQANIDWDEVSARILEAIQAEEPSEPAKARRRKDSSLRILAAAEEKAEKVSRHFMCSACGAVFSTEHDRRQHLRKERHHRTEE